MTRRELLGRTLIGVQVALLAACGGDDDDEADQPAPAREAPQASAPEATQVPQVTRDPVTLRLAASRDWEGSPLNKAIERWNAGGVPGAPEGVQLQRETIRRDIVPEPLDFIKSAQAYLAAFLSERASAGIPPDLLMINSFFDFLWVYGSGHVQPLDRFLQQDRGEPLEKFLPAALDLVRYRNQTMALPAALEAGVTRYKPKQFTDAGVALPDKGWTREEFISAAAQFTEDTDSDGNVDVWGFNPMKFFINWLPFVLQELDEDVVNIQTGAVRLTDPAALRGLQFWDELGRVQGIMPHGETVTSESFETDFTILLSGILFWTYAPPSNMLPGQQAPLPAGPRDVTPLTVSQGAAIPTVAGDAALSYEALIPFALDLGEHSLIPPVISGQQYIEKPTTDYLDLMLPPEDRELVFHLIETARPSPLASSFTAMLELFDRLTLPLARGEMDVVQAAQRGQDWLETSIGP